MTTDTDKGVSGRGPLLRIALWGGAALLLLVPLVAMRFTREVAWTLSDFAVMGVLLAALCGGVELAVRLLRRPLWRVVAILAVIAVFLLVWAQGAVGIF